MNTERGKKTRGFVLLLPVVTALPVIAGLAYMALRFGPTVIKVINIVIKMAVMA